MASAYNSTPGYLNVFTCSSSDNCNAPPASPSSVCPASFITAPSPPPPQPPSSPAQTPALSPPPPPPGVSLVNSCPPTTTTASRCYVGATGPQGALPYLGSPFFEGPFANSTVLLPDDEDEDYICLTAVLSCFQIGITGYPGAPSPGSTGYSFTGTMCPAGEFITLYDAIPAASCNAVVNSLLSAYPSVYSIVSMCNSDGCNAPQSAAALAPPSPPLPLLPRPACPASSAATSCYVGVSGPPGAVAFAQFRTQDSGGQALPSPPAPAPVSPNSACFSLTYSCSQRLALRFAYTARNGTVIPLSAAACPPGQSVTLYSVMALGGDSSCAEQVANLASQTALYSSVSAPCTTNNCNGPATVSAAATAGRRGAAGAAGGSAAVIVGAAAAAAAAVLL